MSDASSLGNPRQFFRHLPWDLTIFPSFVLCRGWSRLFWDDKCLLAPQLVTKIHFPLQFSFQSPLSPPLLHRRGFIFCWFFSRFVLNLEKETFFPPPLRVCSFHEWKHAKVNLRTLSVVIFVWAVVDFVSRFSPQKYWIFYTPARYFSRLSCPLSIASTSNGIKQALSRLRGERLRRKLNAKKKTASEENNT